MRIFRFMILLVLFGVSFGYAMDKPVAVDIDGQGAAAPLSLDDVASQLARALISPSDATGLSKMQSQFKDLLTEKQAGGQAAIDELVSRVRQASTMAAAAAQGTSLTAKSMAEDCTKKLTGIAAELLTQAQDKKEAVAKLLAADLNTQQGKTKKYSIISGLVGTVLAAGVSVLSTYFGSVTDCSQCPGGSSFNATQS